MGDSSRADATRHYEEAQRAFDGATARVMAARVQHSALQANLQSGDILPSDPIVAAINTEMEQAARGLGQARTTLQTATATMQAAEAGPSPFETRLEAQRALVARLDPTLYARYEQELENLNAAIAEEERSPKDPTKADATARARLIYANTRQAVLNYRVAEGPVS